MATAGRYRRYTSAQDEMARRTILSRRSYRSANITLNDRPLDINFPNVGRARSLARIYRAATARSQRSRTFTLDTGESTRRRVFVGVYFVSCLEKSRRRVILAEAISRQWRGPRKLLERGCSSLRKRPRCCSRRSWPVAATESAAAFRI